MQPMRTAIDAHVHVWTDDRKSYPRAASERDYPPARFTPEDLFRHSQPAGVNRIVLIQMSFYRFDNRYMLDCIAKYPGVFSGVGIVDPVMSAERTMLTLAKGGVRGFRIVPGPFPTTWLDNEPMQRMWRTAADHRLAMCCLIGPDAIPSVARMCQRHPETPVVIDHLARIGADGFIRDADVRELCGLSRYSQVKVKVSAFYALGAKKAPYGDLGPFFHRVYDAFGPRRLMWASDCPFQVEEGHTYRDSIELVRSGLPFLKEEDRTWILERTAAETFFSYTK
jgi:predicted TIM-barrel fold metal-dependent hydrolase